MKGGDDAEELRGHPILFKSWNSPHLLMGSNAFVKSMEVNVERHLLLMAFLLELED